MKSPTSVKLRNLADVELAYRRLRDDISAIESLSSVNQNTAALLTSMRRVLVQAVLADRYVGVWVDGSLEAAETVSYTPISTAAELHTIVRGNLKGKFQLTADIDMTADCSVGGAYYNAGAGWEPISTVSGGEGGNPDSGFQGIFDGNGHKITGLMCNRDDTDYQSLFGYVGTGGIIKNLELENITITGRSQVGSVCGGTAGLIYNCHVTGTSSFTGNYTSTAYSGNVGGIIGDNDGTVRLCSVSATVRGLRDVGLICGDNDGLLQYCWGTGDVYCSVLSDAGLISGDNKGFIEYVPMADMPPNKGTIYGCYAVGTVQSFDIAEIGSPTPTGNIALGVGDNRGGRISACWVSGTVSGKNPDVAGFVGNNDLGDNSMEETKDSIVSNCYTLATVTPVGNLPLEGAVGGFVGKNKGGQIYNSYCSSTVSGTAGVDREHVDGFCGNNSNDDLLGVLSGCYFDKSLWVADYGDEDNFSVGKTPAQLKQQATFEGWDFNTVWSIEEGVSFPTLPDMPEASDTETGYVDVYPIQRIGSRDLTGDVRPKIVPGVPIFAEECEDGVVRTPIIVEDRNFPVGRDDITDGAVGKDALGDLNGNDIAGEGLTWDASENLRVNDGDGLSIDGVGALQVNQGFGLDINDDGELVVDPSEFNGDGLDYDPVTGLLSVDLSEVPVTDLDFTDMVDDTTIGFDNPKAYVAGKTYEIEEKCSYSGVNYKSLQDANTGNTPDSSPLWWESMGGQNVLKIKEGLPGDGLQWSTKGHLEVNQGFGLDINGVSGAVDVDPSEFNGNGLDVDVSGNLVVDPSEFIAASGGLDVDGSNNLVVDPGDFAGNGLDVDGSGDLEVDITEVITSRTASAASGDITPTKDLDLIIRTGLTGDVAINNYSGTAPVQGQKLIIRLKDDGTTRAITYGAKYRTGVTLPTDTVVGKTHYLGFIYNSTEDYYDCVAVAEVEA